MTGIETYASNGGRPTSRATQAIQLGSNILQTEPYSISIDTTSLITSADEFSVDHLGSPFNGEGVVECLEELANLVYSQAHKYDVVVGEDTSGRLPALVLRGVINERRIALGLKPAQMRFVSGRTCEIVPTGFMPEPMNSKQRALIVTECISSGRSVLAVYHAIKNERDPSKIDILAIGSNDSAARYVRHLTAKQSRLFTSSMGENAWRHFYYNSSAKAAKGVTKIHGPLFADRRGAERDSARIAQARADIRTLVGRFVEVAEAA